MNRSCIIKKNHKVGGRKMNLKRITMLMAVLAVSVLIGGCSDAKIGVVDVNKVMADSPKVQQFEEKLKTGAQPLIDKLEQEKANLSPEELQKRNMEVGSEIEKMKKDLSAELNESMDKALADIAKEKGLSVILYKNGVAQGGIDVTDDVIKKMQ